MFRDEAQRNKCVSTLLGLSGKALWCDEENGLNEYAYSLAERHREGVDIPLSTSERFIFLIAAGITYSDVRLNPWYMMSYLDLRNRRVIGELLHVVSSTEYESDIVEAWLEKYKGLRNR